MGFCHSFDVFKNGEVRLCADLRSLNNILVDCYPLPKIQEILAATNGSRYFSLNDLKSAYHQVKLSEESKEYTTFITPLGAYRFRRLPFGLASSASVFQKLMECILKGVNCVQKFQDDILIHASSIEEHNRILDTVLHKLNERGMTVSKDKCKFLETEIEYLGHIISSDGIKPKLDLVKAISDAPRPEDRDSPRSFLGLSEYYSRFVENYSEIVEPLRILLRKGEKFLWSESQSCAFQQIKNSIVKAPSLKPYNPEGANIITVDASSIGIGEAFTQIIGNNVHTIAFISRRLQDAEVHYSIIEREALACVWAVDKFKMYLWGKRFEIVTDHKPLTFLMDGYGRGNGKVSARLVRLLAKLQECNFSIRHISGKK